MRATSLVGGSGRMALRASASKLSRSEKSESDPVSLDVAIVLSSFFILEAPTAALWRRAWLAMSSRVEFWKMSLTPTLIPNSLRIDEASWPAMRELPPTSKKLESTERSAASDKCFCQITDMRCSNSSRGLTAESWADSSTSSTTTFVAGNLTLRGVPAGGTLAS